MKTLQSLSIFLLIMLGSISFSFAQDSQKLRSLTNEASRLAYEKEYKKAEALLQEAVLESIKIFGNKHRETGLVYLNLGEIQLARKRYSNAKTSYTQAVAAFNPDELKDRPLIWRAHVKLVSSAAFFKKKKDGNTFLSNARAFVEKSFERNSPTYLSFYQLEQNFYVAIKDFQNADRLFRERYDQIAKLKGKDSPDLEELVDDHMCYSYNNFGKKGNERIDSYKKHIESLYGKKKDDLGDTVNGNAISLPQPSRPSSKRGAIVPVRIAIDKEGNVSKARAVCGLPQFRAASESAALRSKFKPSFRDGKAIPVTGTIVYNYARERRIGN